VTKKLKLDAGVTYNKADFTWDWDFDARSSLTKLSNGADIGAYDTWVQNSGMDEYSDLAYQQYQITLGGTYNITEAVYVKVTGTYDIFDAAEEYVYGDEDGTAYSGYAAIGWTF